MLQLKKSSLNALLAASTAALLTSCASIDKPAEFRRNHIMTFQQELHHREKQLENRSLDLQDCIFLAIAQNYDVKQAELNRQLARIDQSTAFASFLPTITAGTNLNTWSIPQSAGGGNQIADKTYTKANINAGLPLVTPAAYFLYQNSKLGVDVAELSAHYVKQNIILQTSVAFYQVLLTEKMIGTLEIQVAAATELEQRIGGLAKEGLAAEWEWGQAKHLKQARIANLAVYRRKLQADKGELLRLIGMSPMAKIKLNDKLSMEPLDNTSMIELVFQALQQHPSLSIADHRTVMSENAVRASIANFLPVVSSFVNGSWTSDSFAKHAGTLYGGFAASVDLFKGFTKYNQYKSSKISKLSSQFDREATFLSVILEVVKARNQVSDALDSLAVAKTQTQYLNAKYQDYSARQKEGLMPINEVLDAQGDAQAAEVEEVKATYQNFLARIQLSMALGSIQVPGEDKTGFPKLAIKPVPYHEPAESAEAPAVDKPAAK